VDRLQQFCGRCWNRQPLLGGELVDALRRLCEQEGIGAVLGDSPSEKRMVFGPVKKRPYSPWLVKE
jgi:hypothetical protein